MAFLGNVLIRSMKDDNILKPPKQWAPFRILRALWRKSQKTWQEEFVMSLNHWLIRDDGPSSNIQQRLIMAFFQSNTTSSWMAVFHFFIRTWNTNIKTSPTVMSSCSETSEDKLLCQTTNLLEGNIGRMMVYVAL